MQNCPVSLGISCISKPWCLLQGMCVCVHTELSRHVWLFETPWTIVCKAPLTRSFSRREYWSGFPFPPPGDLPDPGVKPEYPAYPALAGGFFTLSYLRCPPLHGAQLHCNDLWFFRGNTRLKKIVGVFPGGPVVKTLQSQLRGPGFAPSLKN